MLNKLCNFWWENWQQQIILSLCEIKLYLWSMIWYTWLSISFLTNRLVTVLCSIHVNAFNVCILIRICTTRHKMITAIVVRIISPICIIIKNNISHYDYCWQTSPDTVLRKASESFIIKYVLLNTFESNWVKQDRTNNTVLFWKYIVATNRYSIVEHVLINIPQVTL